LNIDKENKRKQDDEDSTKTRRERADKRVAERLQYTSLSSAISAQINTSSGISRTSSDQDTVAQSFAPLSTQEISVFSESLTLFSSASSLTPTNSEATSRPSESFTDLSKH
jgi:hypothetical protein